MNCHMCGTEMEYSNSHFVEFPALEIPGLGVRTAYSDFVPPGWDCPRCTLWIPFWQSGEYTGIADGN